MLSGPPEPVRRLAGRRVQRMLRPLVHPGGQPLLGVSSSAVPFWERRPDHPSIAVVEPEGPISFWRDGPYLACRFEWLRPRARAAVPGPLRGHAHGSIGATASGGRQGRPPAGGPDPADRRPLPQSGRGAATPALDPVPAPPGAPAPFWCDVPPATRIRSGSGRVFAGQILGHGPAEGDEHVAPGPVEGLEEGGDVLGDGFGLGGREVEAARRAAVATEDERAIVDPAFARRSASPVGGSRPAPRRSACAPVGGRCPRGP